MLLSREVDTQCTPRTATLCQPLFLAIITMQWVDALDDQANDGFSMWESRRRARVRVSLALNPAKVSLACPELELVEVSPDDWQTTYMQLEDLFLDNLIVPTAMQKDAGWKDNSFSLLSDFLHLSRYSAAWEVMLALLGSDDDWNKVYTIRGLASQITLRLPTAGAAIIAKLTISSPDFIRFDAVSFEHLNYRLAEAKNMNFLKGAVYERGSLASSDTGRLQLARFMRHFIGPPFHHEDYDVGSSCYHTGLALEQWAKQNCPFSDITYDLHHATPLDVQCAFAQLGGALRTCIIPVNGWQQRPPGFARQAWLKCCLRFGDCILNGKPTTWLVDMMTANLPSAAPCLSMLLGSEPSAWGSTLSHVLRLLERLRRPDAQHIIIDMETIPALEQFFAHRMAALRHFVHDNPDDAQRVSLLMSGTLGSQSLMKLPPDVDTSNPAANFAAQAAAIKQQASFMDIKKDILALQAANATGQTIIKVMLKGKTAADPTRRTNAVTLAILFQAKCSHLDNTLSFTHQLLEDGLPLLLGEEMNVALRYPTTNRAPLNALATLLQSSADKFNVNAFDLSTLAILPCKKARFPKQAAMQTVESKPFSSLAGLRENLEPLAIIMELLGPPDDAGSATAPPMSPRSLWNVLIDFIRDYHAHDPATVEAIVESTAKGILHRFFKYKWFPLIEGKAAHLQPAQYLVDLNCPVWTSFAKIRRSVMDKVDDETSKTVDVSTIPGYQFCTTRSPAGGSMHLNPPPHPPPPLLPPHWPPPPPGLPPPGFGLQPPLLPPPDAAQPKALREQEKLASAKARQTASKLAMATDNISLSNNRKHLHIGKRGYDIGSMRDYAAANNLWPSDKLDEVNWASLVLRKTVEPRTPEGKAFFPAAKLNFEGDYNAWMPDARQLFFGLKVGEYRLDVDKSIDGRKPTGRAPGGKGRREGGGPGPPAPKLLKSAAAAALATGTKAAHVDLHHPDDSQPRTDTTDKSGMQTDADATMHNGVDPTHGADAPLTTHLPRTPPMGDANSNPLPPKDAGWVTAVKSCLAKAGQVFHGFERTGTGPSFSLTFLLVSCLLADPAQPDHLLIGDKSGKMRSNLQLQGFKVLSVDPHPTDLPGLSYRGLAEDIAFTKHWRAVYIMTPCDDDAMSGSQYFPQKVLSHIHYWSQFLSIIFWCIPCDAAVLEHPLSMLEKTWRPAHQTIQPYFFGPDDDSPPPPANPICSKKTTRLFIRGWNLVHATNLIPGDHKDRKHAMRIHDPIRRSVMRSKMSWNMTNALTDQLNGNTVIEGSPQPDMAHELMLFDSNYARLYGEHSLPSGHGNLQHLLPPGWLDSVTHRAEVHNAAILASGRPTPPWPPTLYHPGCKQPPPPPHTTITTPQQIPPSPAPPTDLRDRLNSLKRSRLSELPVTPVTMVTSVTAPPLPPRPFSPKTL